jgi:hypothetical protein
MPNVSGTWYGLPVPGPATGQVIDFGVGDLPPVPAHDVGDALELSLLFKVPACGSSSSVPRA